MSLTRSALREKGVTEKEILDYIMEEHGNMIEATKEKAKETSDKATEKLKAEMLEMQKKIDATPEPDPNAKDWKAEHTSLQEKYDADIAAKDKELADYKAGVSEKETASNKQAAIKAQLEADGANPKLVKLLMSEFDLTKVELEDGKVKGWDDVSKTVKESYADVFGEKSTKGAGVATPPAGKAEAADPFMDGFNAQ